MPKIYSVEIGGRDLHFETGHLAQQASGSVLVRYGENAVLVTAVMSDTVREGIDFVPLTVDYMERAYAGGRVPGSFFRREIGRPSEKETLSSRLIDRPMRPLFPKGVVNEIQIIATVLSGDMELDPDIVALNGAAAALEISDIPFNGPISEVRIAKIDDKFVINPDTTSLAAATMDIVVSGSEKEINMVEGSMREQSEEDMIEALKIAHDAIKQQCRAQKEFMALCGKAKREYTRQEEKPEIKEKIIAQLNDKK